MMSKMGWESQYFGLNFFCKTYEIYSISYIIDINLKELISACRHDHKSELTVYDLDIIAYLDIHTENTPTGNRFRLGCRLMIDSYKMRI